MRFDLAPCNASAARLMSRSLARAREHTVESLIALAIDFTASKSPLEDAAKPASITSTRSRSSCIAMRSFSSRVIEAPGLCSPSRKVVSKMIKRSVISGSSENSRGLSSPGSRLRRGTTQIVGGSYLRAGRSSSSAGSKRGAAEIRAEGAAVGAMRGSMRAESKAKASGKQPRYSDSAAASWGGGLAGGTGLTGFG